ncbi:MAG: hypothetical protein JWM87_3252 [Candidatus Eremiobacteraeota bacterium]|nr:hypothetical protein [Candidatus Eremiobacteraeota bacterium]
MRVLGISVRAAVMAACGFCLVFAGPRAGVAAPDQYQIVLGEMGHSSQHGVATLRAEGGKTRVTIKLTGGPADPQPSHFHTGTCESYGPRPLYMLQSIVNGESSTTLDIPIDRLLKGDLVINVHRSLTDIASVTACGVSRVP